jgi:hypothetical protein
MPEPKPTYKVNPAIDPNASIMAAINKTITETQEAFDETARLLREALQVMAPFTGHKGTITVDYGKWDTMNNVLSAIREKYIEWQNTTRISEMNEIINEIPELLKKAGY